MTASEDSSTAVRATAALGADRIDPLAMTLAQTAKVLSAVGVGTVSQELLQRHIAAGAPATSDGRINLVHYAAWLNGRLGKDSEGAGDHGA